MKKKISKKLKIIKILSFILIGFLVVELIYFGIIVYKDRKNSTYYTIVNDLVLLEDGYVAVGFSDFKHSSFNKTSDYNKAIIWKYNDAFEAVKEEYIKLGYNSHFNDVIELKDGYVAVGAITMTETQLTDNVTEGLIVRFDKDFNIIWRENVQILDDTDLLKVKLDKNNNLIIVGQSIYAKNIIGNQTTGGAILLKYNLDGEELFKFNYGGPFTGMFNDVYIESDGYVVVGVTGTETGIIQKYDFKGNEIWHNYYGPTEINGITNIYKDGNNYLVTTTKLPSKGDSSSYKAVVAKYNANGKLVDEISYDKKALNIFKNLYIEDDYIYAVGATGDVKDGNALTDAFVIKYDKKFNIVDEKYLEIDEKHDKNDSYDKIYKTNDKYLIVGKTNSKIKEYKTNGYDYYPIFVEY